MTPAAWISAANLVLLIGIAVLGLWIKDKFFTPLRIDLLNTTAELRASIVAEQSARKIELVTMNAAVAAQGQTVAALAEAVRSLDKTSASITEHVGASIVALAQEQGRLATAEHNIRNEIAAVKVRQEFRIHREQASAWDGFERRKG